MVPNTRIVEYNHGQAVKASVGRLPDLHVYDLGSLRLHPLGYLRAEPLTLPSLGGRKDSCRAPLGLICHRLLFLALHFLFTLAGAPSEAFEITVFSSANLVRVSA